MNDKPLKINTISTYRDGGTISVQTNRGEFTIDHRINTSTKGRWYKGYAGEADSRPATEDEKAAIRDIMLSKSRDYDFARPDFDVDDFFKDEETPAIVDFGNKTAARFTVGTEILLTHDGEETNTRVNGVFSLTGNFVTVCNREHLKFHPVTGECLNNKNSKIELYTAEVKAKYEARVKAEKDRQEAERLEKKRQADELMVHAEAWFDDLTDEQQLYVEILAPKKCRGYWE